MVKWNHMNTMGFRLYPSNCMVILSNNTLCQNICNFYIKSIDLSDPKAYTFFFIFAISSSFLLFVQIPFLVGILHKSHNLFGKIS